MREGVRPKAGNARAVWSIEVDPESGELTQAGRQVSLTGKELVAALRKALAADHAKASAIVDSIAEPIMIFGPESTLDWCNSFAEFTFGGGSVVRGTPCHLVVCDNAKPCKDCPISTFNQRGPTPGTVRFRRNLRTSEGITHPFELTLRRLQGRGDRSSTVVLLRDIGEESAQELALRARLKRDDLRLELSDLLLSSTSLREMLSGFCERSGKALGLCTVAVLLRTTNGWLVPVRVLHLGEVVVGAPSLIAPSTLGLKPVLVNRRTVLVRDVDRSPAALSITAVIERLPGAGSGSMVIAPLSNRTGDVIGAVVAGRVEVDGFEQDEVDLVGAVSARLGLAVGTGLAAEATQRVTQLQKALLEQGEIMASKVDDFVETSGRVLEGLCKGAGFPMAAAILYNPLGETVTLFRMYSGAHGHVAFPMETLPLAACPFFEGFLDRADVAVLHPASLSDGEREDPVLARLLQEGGEGLAIVSTGADKQTLGWFAFAVPDPLWLSTPVEVDVLRSISQQTRIALSWILSDGRFQELLEALEDHRLPRAGGG